MCMLCQAAKREQWVDRLRARMLQVPYVHMVFTLPHELHGLCRLYPQVLYRILFTAAWRTVQGIEGIGVPGMTAVLHTFGSDLKYHVHLHALVTFGGLGDQQWHYPSSPRRIERYRTLCSTFRSHYLALLLRSLAQYQHTWCYHTPLQDIIGSISAKRWVVHSTHPTMQTQAIETYIGRYISRIAITRSRLQYIASQEKVQIIYHDYKHQLTGQAPPKAYKTLHPLEAIHQILQHILPSGMAKSRHYGLHHHTFVHRHSVPAILQRQPLTIRTILQIITQMIKDKPYHCAQCHSASFHITSLLPDPHYKYTFLSPQPHNINKSPPPTLNIDASTPSTTYGHTAALCVHPTFSAAMSSQPL
jgi:hypothetical protein